MSVGPGPNVTGNVSSTDASVAGLTGDPNAGMASLDPNNSQSANSAQPAGGTPPVIQPFGFGGNVQYYYEPIGGVIIAWNRAYDNVVGTWYSRDPIGFDGGTLNWYEYVANNPVRWVDPTGTGPVAKNPPPVLPIAPYRHPPIKNPYPGDYGYHCGASIFTPGTKLVGTEDAIDLCCANHDKCSEAAQQLRSYLAQVLAQHECDHNLCGCAKKVSRDGCSKPCMEEAQLIEDYYCEGGFTPVLPSLPLLPCL